ncbi:MULTISPECIES: ABC transporter family substrate-binding protein [unclassified Actinomyces]|uniref:ABC transporter family substrate-binding protein n=1 Tax=unclassified Actinomyces TaxID=2609248 RepID=UPI00137380CB|nr:MULTISPECIES: ABC transporter family substrate-binding protein [unclassified Actinomyces]MBW3069524.1 ABC transporter family substrate-binding protein [Actinomyces sp. 594]NDR53483.1 ABC transporter family substrate-binding protein [Actinomyces sp. 565]QHO90499.1 ABC transporter substrate-binding protein [Actinomyces sp. 432]
MNINRRLFLAGSASAAVMAALAACAKNTESNSNSSADANAEIDFDQAMNRQERSSLQQGGTLNFAISNTIANWNYHHANGVNVNLRNILDFVSPYLLDWADDGTPTANPNFYTTFEAEDVDGKTVATVALNENAVWGNGRHMDSEDIEAFFAHADDPEYQWASTDGIADVESVDIIDDLTAKVTFKSIFPDWTNPLSSLFPKELFVDAKTFNESMAGAGAFNNDYFAGPFKVDSYNESQQLVTLVPNDLWWGEAPLLDKVTFRVLDPAAEATSFANKAIDVIDYIISADVYNQAAGREDAEIRQNFGLQWRHFTINAASGPLADKAVRQAVLRACDRAAIASSDLAGLPIEVDDVLLGNHFFMPPQEGYQDNSGDWSYDPDAAKQLLDDAGWVEGADGVREKDGQRLSFTFTVPSGTQTTENEANLLQSQLSEVGIEMKLDPVDANSYFPEYINAKNYEMTAFTWEGTQYPMANIGQIYGSSSLSNYTSQSIPEIDDYAAKIASTPDHDERIRMTNECDVLIWENVMNFPIYERMQFTAVPKNLANFGAKGLAYFRSENVGYISE